jgi:plastocyanin
MLGARRILPSAALIAMALAPSPAGGAQAADVIVSDNFYTPKTLTVQAGSTVLWEQQGNLPHDITADDRSWSSHPACAPFAPGTCMADGDTYSRAFPEPGTFGYYCTLHGSPGNSMAGTIRVVEPGFVFPTTVDDVRATKSGTGLKVLGSATFGGLAPSEVGTDVAGDSVHGLPAILGYDLTKASIGQPTPGSGDLSFVLDLVDLPPTGGLPDAAIYYWDLNLVPPGGQPYGFRIQGSLTELSAPPVPSTETPAFTVRGCGSQASDCTFSGTPVDAVMDGAANRITATVPTGVLAQVTGQTVIGSEIVGGTFGYEGAAATSDPQFSGTGGPATDRLTITGSHLVAARSVMVDVVPVGATPSFGTAATLAEDGSFTADVGGLAPGAYDVWARACFGTNCATRSTTVTL